MKIRGLFKKAAATLMAAVTALSILPATTAFAAGDIGTISFSHTYDSSGNAMRYIGMLSESEMARVDKALAISVSLNILKGTN